MVHAQSLRRRHRWTLGPPRLLRTSSATSIPRRPGEAACGRTGDASPVAFQVLLW
jgi:hypothetical protein